MAVLWVNDSAEDKAARAAASHEPPSLEDAIPLAQTIGVREAIGEALSSGAPQHLHADLVSTSKGAMALAVSVYLLPGGLALVLAENTWRTEPRVSRPGGAQRARRGGR
jgi:hypothetical protein